jgi:RNA polymerase sigma factor (sigma-70 family)
MFGRRSGNLPGPLARSRFSSESFAEFYERLSPVVLGFFVRETGDGHRALDLTAETFAKAFEKRHDFRGAGDEQAAAWLWQIARNELARSRRSRSVELGAMRRLGLERPVLTDQELLQIERMGVEEDVHQHLQDAVARLPRDQREVIQLRFIEELSYPEIAETLGVSYDLARTRTSRALRALRASHQMHDVVHLRET